MAKYLWVGSTASAYPGPMAGASAYINANLVDQYNFNKAGNWLVQVIQGGQIRWVSTSATPGGGDTVIFGGEFFGAAPGLSGFESNGWTAARSPCLFGGFSGGVGNGSWSNTSGVGAGTSFSTPLLVIQGDLEKGYNFPFLGGGLTGDVALWASYRDGISAAGPGWYVKAYSSGVRDPQANLKLKWKNFNQIWNNRPLGAAPGETAGITYTNTFIYDFDGVKALTQIGASGACGATANFGTVSNILNFSGKGGAGLRIRSGSINTVYINPQGPGANAEEIQYSTYGSYNDCGVELYNSFVKQLYINKWQATYVKGCTLGNVDVYPIALSVTRYSNPPRYEGQAPVEIASNIDVNATLTDILGSGLTWSSSDYSQYMGNLNLQLAAPTVRINAIGDIVSSPSLQSGNRHTVVVGDRISNATISIPKINIYSGLVTGLSGSNGSATEVTGIFPYMPWAVEYAGTVLVTTMFNYGGSIYSNSDISPDATLNISEIYLSDTGTLDFSKRFSGFDQWLIGGLCASNGQIYGGIIFNDETGKVLGSAGVRLWNTQTKANNTINTRIPSAPPASTQPPNIAL